MTKSSVFILTGAGISAESGIRTFRAADGLWENHRIEDVATPEAFSRNPNLVYEFYNQRRRQLKDAQVKPNAAHLALAELEAKWPGKFLLVTQNVDNLHERAGSKDILHMHGELNSAWCRSCDHRQQWREDLSADSTCTTCNQKGNLRPDIVWFGEMPYESERTFAFLENCEIFISVGTSGVVYPAAGFAREAHRARRIEVNVQGTDISNFFHEHRLGPAGVEVPQLVKEILASITS